MTVVDGSAKRNLEIVYSAQSSDYVRGRIYANPRLFTTARAGVSKVIVIGDWPRVVAAYQKLDVPVVVLQPGQSLDEAESARPVENPDERTHDPGAVEIPVDYATLSWQKQRTLAHDILGPRAPFPVRKEEVIEIVESELRRREA